MHAVGSILPLRAAGVSFEAGGNQLIDNISFTLPKGGISALIGANGAGKSLTLRLCHGLIPPGSGSIAWSGDADGARKAHAMVFQRPVMLRRSVRANIIHPLKATGVRERAQLTETTIARFGFGAMADRPARLLSGGEQQRLAIARAWALQPELLFMDEPTGALDPGATRQIEEIILGLAAEGVTILIATQDLGQARRLSTRVLFLDRGRLLEDTPTEQFFTRPSTAEGRRFIAGELVW